MRFNSIAMPCQQCAVITYIKPSHAAKGAGKFCSRACMSAFKAEQNTRICEQCSTTFQIPPGRIQKGYGKFCSRVCADLGRTKEAVERTCERCGLSFSVAPFRVAQGAGKFCSIACRDDARRGVPGPLSPNRHTVVIACEHCGAQFRPKAPNQANPQRFCGWDCKSAAEVLPLTIPDDERDLIYLAGFIDGEGTITAHTQISPTTGREGISLRVLVSNTNAAVMQWLSAAFGGKLSEPRGTRSVKHKPVMTWTIGAGEAVRLCRRLLPYLRIKQRHAEIVLALAALPYETGNGHGRTVSDETRAAWQPLLRELRALNHRGILPA
jgi:hypothetical protein